MTTADGLCALIAGQYNISLSKRHSATMSIIDNNRATKLYKNIGFKKNKQQQIRVQEFKDYIKNRDGEFNRIWQQEATEEKKRREFKKSCQLPKK